MWPLEIIAAMLAVGSLAGFIAELLGVGGGTIIVPVALWALQLQGTGNHPYAQRLAVGTSFAVMLFTTPSSVAAQHKKQSIDWQTVMRITPGMTADVFIGAASAKYMPTVGLQVFFIAFISIITVRTLVGIKPKPSRTLPRLAGLNTTDVLFGAVSSWVGIGGGSLSMPFLIYCNMPPHKAVDTSSGLAWPIVLAGIVDYLAAGRHISNLPDDAVGFLYLSAIAILSTATIAFAPLGVKTAHKLPPEALKIVFDLLLLAIAARMLQKMVWPLPYETQAV